MISDDDNSALEGAHLDTLAVRAGISRTHEGEHSEPIFTTSSYVFDNAAQAPARIERGLNARVYGMLDDRTLMIQFFARVQISVSARVSLAGSIFRSSIIG